jgi:hypothetical protein
MNDFSPKRKHMKLLEDMFGEELHQAMSGNGMPFQTRAKAIQALADHGYVAPHVVKLGGRFPVTVTGWQLTHLGRMTYCATCEGEPD